MVGQSLLVKVKISGKPGTSKRFLHPISTDLKSQIFVPVMRFIGLKVYIYVFYVKDTFNIL